MIKTHMKRYAKQGVAIMAILAMSAVVSVSQNRSASADNCSDLASSVVTGQFLVNGENGGGALALFQNASDCTYTVGVASYQNGNTLFDSKTTTIPAWQQVQIHVSVPACAYEVDMFRGQVLSNTNYGSNLIAKYNGHQNVSCGTTPTNPTDPTDPTDPTPTKTPTPTPVNPTPTPASTPTPTSGPTNRGPIGSFDGANCDVIGGWAYDPDSSSTSITVAIYDGLPTAAPLLWSGVTTGLRSDVNSALGISGNHGFTISTPASLKNGATHQIYILGYDANTGNGSFFDGPKTLNTASCITSTPTPTPTPGPTNHAPAGSLDGVQCDIIGGWSYDQDSPNSATAVHFYYDGPAGSGKFLTDAWPNTNRPDVNAALGISGVHGFTFFTPAVLKDGNAHTVYAYAIDSDPSHSMNAALQGSPKTIQCAVATPTPTPVSTPTPTPVATPTPAPAVTPTPTPTQNVQNIITTNSNNTTNTNTINNTSNITQNGNGNIAQVNQSGAQQYSTTGAQNNIAAIYAAVVTPTPTPYFYPYQTPYPTYVPTPTPATALVIQKYGRNISRGGTSNLTSVSARPGDTIEFNIVVTNSTNTTLSNINVIDYLPAGLNYVSGSTALNGTAIANGITNSSGVNVGYLYAGQRDTIRFFVTVDANARNGQSYTNNSSVRADNHGTINSNPVYVTVSGTVSVIAKGLHVPTGPADVGMAFALMGSLTATGAYLKRKGLLSLIRLA